MLFFTGTLKFTYLCLFVTLLFIFGTSSSEAIVKISTRVTLTFLYLQVSRGAIRGIAQIHAEYIVQMSGVFWLPLLYAGVEKRFTRREKALESQSVRLLPFRKD